MKFVNTLCIALLVAFASSSFAQETATEGKTCSQCPASSAVAKSESCSGATCSSDESCSSCPVSIAMNKLPKMTYKIGDKETCCSESAAALAKEHSKPIHFVVAEKTYEDKTQAYTALVESTENFVNEFVTPSKCEKSGKTSIAGKSCNCPVEAGQRAEMVKKAVMDVKMSYVVGEETCNCPNKAKALAAKSETETKFVVAGEEVCCPLEARMKLAKAKYAAAVKALASTEKKTETKATGT